MVVTAVFLLCAFSCSALALSQDRHWRIVAAQNGVARKDVARALGWTLLIFSLVFLIWREGPSFGVLLWGMITALAIFATAILLAYRPQLLKPIAAILRRR